MGAGSHLLGAESVPLSSSGTPHCVHCKTTSIPLFQRCSAEIKQKSGTALLQGKITRQSTYGSPDNRGCESVALDRTPSDMAVTQYVNFLALSPLESRCRLPHCCGRKKDIRTQTTGEFRRSSEHTPHSQATNIIAMSKKQVRFTDDFPRTPSPSSSISSLPSSPGPFTPPSGFQPLPSLNSVAHPALQNLSSPSLDFDVTQYKPKSTNPKLPLELELDLPATSPPSEYMEIISPNLPWRVIIQPGKGVPGAPAGIITVRDVLFGIYTSLRQPILQTEFDLVPDAQVRNAITEAYRSRCNSSSDLAVTQHELKRGIRRVDFLRGESKFLGITPAKAGSHVWVLHTCKQPW